MKYWSVRYNSSVPTTYLAYLLALIATLLLSFGCKKSAEELEKLWPSNVGAVDTLAAQYPAFKAALEERKAAAKALYDEAQSLTDDEKQEKLDSATAELRRGFIGKLRGLDSSIAGLRKDLLAATTGASDAKFLEAAKMLSSQATLTLQQVDSRLKSGAATASDADAVLNKVTSEVESIRKQLKSLKRSSKKAAEAKKAAASATEAKQQKSASWKCSYCQSKNKAGTQKCENCGASRTGK